MTKKHLALLTKPSNLSICIGVTFGLLSSPVVAQQFEDAASIEFGSFDFTPTVDFGLHFDDNLTKAATGEIDSWSWLISPQLNLQSSYGANQVTLAYRLRNESFFSSGDDNYTDHFLVADVDFEFDARNRMQIGVEFEDGHDERGSNFSIGTGQTLDEPDQYKQTQFDAVYSYGAFNADGRLEVNFNIRDLNYDINTNRYRARDRQFASLGATFLYRIGAVTDLTLDVKQTEVDYKFALDRNNPLDSTIVEYLVGVKWEATAKTAGFVKVGYETKDFDSDLRKDFGGFDWAAGVTWEPTEYASIEFITRADTNETNGEGNFIRGRTHSVQWQHEWLERLRSSATITLNNDRYEGQVLQGFGVRSDDNFSLNASVYYQFRRWINFEVGYRYSERDSNRDLIDFDRNQFVINALITL